MMLSNEKYAERREKKHHLTKAIEQGDNLIPLKQKSTDSKIS